ncbi:hypothetical protein C8J55DRAFT_609616 [Lentinula edodes]|uniref:F-box domain-containing protein n=1 Tax=Lentinula lateritia TaxID=40482 RepID=A0A9W9DDY3_9AGAR|nr:hypothetical protein C8J55DRAFT_609616 [Lentinula edodes]
MSASDLPDEIEEHAISERWRTFSSLPTTQLRAILTQEQIDIHILRDKLSAAEKKVAMIKTILSPFSRLPQELISEIFHVYCATQGVIYDAFQKRNSRTRPSKVDPDRIVSGVFTIPPQLILTQICSYWRTVAHETRSLWTNLTVYIQTGKFTHHEQLIENWLNHSGQNMPLDIFLSVPKGKGQVTKSIMLGIIPFANRWRRLELSAPFQTLRPLLIRTLDAPLLEHVRMNICHITESSMLAYSMDVTFISDGYYPAFHNAPKLYSFDCGAIFDPDTYHEDTFSFLTILPQPQQLTRLAMNGNAFVPSIAGGFSLLGVYAHNLVSLSIHVSRDAPDAEAPFPLTFPQLRSLSVVASFPFDGDHFFKQLTLPVLETFEFTIEKDCFMNDQAYTKIIDMQARSSFVLKEIAICNALNASNLCTFLEMQNSLRRLSLSALHSCKLQNVVSWLSHKPSALPCLQELHLLGGQMKMGSEDPWKGLVDIIHGRAQLPGEPMGVCGNLQLLDIRMSKTAFGRMDKDELNSLQRYRDLGLDIRFLIWLSNGTLVDALDHLAS